MATDLKLTTAHDLSLTSGDIDLVTEGTEVAQSAKIRLLFLQAEWVLDYTMGVPWIDEIFNVQYSREYKELLLRRVVLNTPGIRTIRSFSYQEDPTNRGGQITFEVDTIYADVIVEVTI